MVKKIIPTDTLISWKNISKRNQLLLGLIGTAILLLIILGGILYAKSSIQLQNTNTPIAPIPDLDSIMSPTETPRSEVLDEQILANKKASRNIGISQRRIRNSWDFYTNLDTSKQAEVIEPDRPERKRMIQRPRRVPAKDPDPSPPAPTGFNLILEEAHFNEQDQPTIPNNLIKRAPRGKKLFKGMITSTQTVEPGGWVSLRTTEEININGTTIPAHTSLSGKTTFNKGRVFISGSEISLDGEVLSLHFEVYDPSRIKGLTYNDQKLAKSIKRQIAREGTQQLRQQVPPTSIPFVDVGIRAASEGIRTLTGANKARQFTFSAHFPILINIY